MGIAPTGAIYKTLTFDSANSGTYGVYITGEAVYNAPERDVEMIEIPGRNGAFALDHGRFQNIEVSYPAGIFADDETDFAQAISDFRNLLCSKKGYCKLTDDYNDGEYRMAVYKSGLEVTPAQLRAGEFEIVFECKPQRFLVSGEDKITVTSGDDINNPTLFDAKPLIEATGYGTMNIGADEIEVHNEPVGNIIVYNRKSWNSGSTRTITIDTQYANAGDTITVKQYSTSAVYWATWTVAAGTVTSATATVSGQGSGSPNVMIYGTNAIQPQLLLADMSVSYGTSSTQTVSMSLSIVTTNYGTVTGSMSMTLAYNGSNTFTLSRSVTLPNHFTSKNPHLEIMDITLYSTQSILGDPPVYIDLDIGEAYVIKSGEVAPANNGVVIPAELPVLAPGNTTITYDNTFTKIEIIPRYWIV